MDVARLFAADLVEDQLRAGLVERRWLRDRVESALAGDECRCLLLTARPGWGKTAFAAWFVDRHAGSLRYFIRRDSRQPLNSGGARAFLTAIGHQLAARRPELFTSGVEIDVRQTAGRVDETGEMVGARIGELVASPFRTVALRVVQDTTGVSGRVVGVDLERVVGDERLIPLPDLQDLALLDPAHELAARDPGARIVIVVDGLDELRHQLPTETVLDWLAAVNELPANVRLVLTSRPDDVLLDPLRRRQQRWLRELPLDDVVEDVDADLTAYASRIFARPAVERLLARGRHDAAAAVRQVVPAAAGNFLYLRTVLDAIEQAATEPGAARRVEELLSPGRLPHELDELYALLLTLLRHEVGGEHLSVPGDRLGEDVLVPAWEALYRPVLGMLATAREPVSPAEIRILAGIRGDDGTTTSAIGRMRPFLLRQDGRYRLFHATMQAFLTSDDTAREHPDLAVPRADWQARVAGNALRRHQPDWTSTVDGYTLAHVVAHLSDALRSGDEPEPGRQRRLTAALIDLLTSVEFIAQKVTRLGVDELLADLRDGRSVVSSPRIDDVERLCALEAHHLRRAAGAGSGMSAIQQLHLRAGALGVTWLREEIDRARAGHAGLFLHRVWDRRAASPDLRLTMIGHTGWVTGTALSADGRTLVTTSSDRTARLWRTATGRNVRSLRHDAEFGCAAVDAAGRWAVLGDETGRITWWDLDSGESRVLPVRHRDRVVAVAIVLDGRHAVSGSRDGTLRLWAVATGDVRGEADGLGPIRDVVGGRSASRVAVADGGPLAVWDLPTGALRRLDEPGAGITALAVTADGGRVVSGSQGGLGEVWSVDPPAKVGEFAGPPNTDDVAVTPDGRHAVVVAGAAGHVIDIAADRAAQRLDGHAVTVFAVDVSGDGATVVTGGQDRTVKVWSLRPGPAAPDPPMAHSRRVSAVARTPAGDRVLSVAQDWTLRIWDAGGTLLHTCPHQGWAQSLALSADGRYAITGSLGQLYVWDVDDGRLAFRRPVPGVDGIRCLAAAPDHRSFWMGAEDGRVYQLLDGDWTPRGPLTGHTDAVNTLALSPAGGMLASASQDGTVRIWDLNTFEHRVAAHDVPVFAVCFTGDGDLVASGGDDGVIRFWSAASGDDAGHIEAHDGWVLGLAPGPGGGRLLSVSEDGTLAIWDLATRRLRSRVGLETVLWCLSPIAEDMRLAVGDLGGGVQLLRIEDR
ncbi:WD40 repeat domain-containing protein [Actinoplanes sp. CA-030573]|uniref:WD40 repeat domain-containing protein n=1 Tax=Actinoplanes sp. CA-030573 TaxID=3239898 RepID=UPI003D89CD6F